MAKYSSDSDSDHSGKYRKKHNRRSRSSSSGSSDSSSYRKRSSKYSKSRRHRRSCSKSRDNQSYKSARGSSKGRERRRYKSPERNKKKTRSASREKSMSRTSSSQSYMKSSTEKNINILTKDEFIIGPRINESVLDEINSSGFTQKQFTSSVQSREKKINKNIVIDITSDTIQVPPATKISSTIHESIFHTSIMMDQEARFERWVKKFFNLRQKAMAEVSPNVT